MTVWDFSGSLVRLAVLLGALVAFPYLWRWAGGRARAYLIAAGGLLFMAAWEGSQVVRAIMDSGLQPAGVAWDAVSVQAIGYIAILLGILVWIHDLRQTRDELKRSNLALQEVASTDFLTGLLSRRQASFLLSFETARARRSKLPLGFIMIDLDHFKQVNDTHGHAAGDAVLAHIGHLLKQRLRASDIVSRYGGEEFLVLVPAATLDGTVALANTLRESIETTPVEHKGVAIRVTASFGVVVSQVGQDANSAEEALQRADAALYAAKALGRNRVVNWEDVAPRPEELAAIAAN
jgi:diguanylate cyclase (GGDEF)-like protein